MNVPSVPSASAPTGFAADMWDDPEAFADIVLPMIAGARARGIADAFELLGLAVILLDGMGRVLHATAAAQRLTGHGIRFVERHVLADDPRSNDVLQGVIGETLGSPGAAEGVCGELHAAGGATLRVRAQSFPGDEEGSSQLLRALLFLTRVQP